MRIYFDTEFYEDGKTIDLISLGAVREDGRQFYAESSDFKWSRVPAQHWIQKNVKPYLYKNTGEFDNFLADGHTGGFMRRNEMRYEFFKFCNPRPEFWAYFCSYDWLCVCQLFGTMMDLPNGWPMYCNDLVALSNRHGIRLPTIESMGLKAHVAINDALWTKFASEHVESVLAFKRT